MKGRPFDAGSVPYVELCVRSNFSFLRGASSPEVLVQRAAELGYAEIAITDFAGLYGTVRAMLEAEESKMRLVTGCEVPLANPSDERTLLLHVENHEGYQHLCRILSEAHRARDEKKNRAPNVPVELVAAHAGGLYCTAPASLDRKDLTLLEDAFGARLSLGIYRHLDGEDARREREVIAMNEALGIPIVAHNAVRFALAEHKPVLDVLHCIRKGITLDDAGRELLPNAEARLRSPEEMLEIFADHPEWIARTRVISDACRFSLRELKYKFPCDITPGETPDATLRRMTYEGAALRYGGSAPESVRAQIEKELALIAQLEVAPYFLSVRAIVDIARERDILCQGRGSAANSAVCYCLGVTAVDPSRSKMLFERFLSPERREPPDIDVDFEHERREEVIQEIYRRYGRDRAAMVSEVICYRGKSALREVGKVFGFSLEQVARLSSLVSWWDPIPGQNEMGGDRGGEAPRWGRANGETRKAVSARSARGGTQSLLETAKFDASDARVGQCLQMARAIRGYPRHLSIHVGGFILSAEPLERIAPIEPATMPDRTVVPWDKDDVDALGFFKVDVLGLGMLTTIRKALQFVAETETETETERSISALDLLAAIPPEDPVVYDALCAADTVGVFQIESRAQMAMLPRLRPRKFYDLVIEVAIVRPGPIQGGMVHPYLRRRNGEEPIDVPHAILWPILERTLGVPLFQEQVMQIAIVGAGYSGGEADQLRRDMAAWKRNGKLARHRERLQRGFRERGISEAFGERLYKQIQGFGEYGFPESHAASFALLVYASAWLKVHHPAAFAAALVNSQPMGFYSVNTILKDAQHHGVEIRPIRVEYSNWDCSLEDKGGDRGGEAPRWGRDEGETRREVSAQSARGGTQSLQIRIGLRQVKGLGEEAGRRVEAARKARAFESLEDLRARAELDQKEMDALAESGALELLGGETRQAMWLVRAPRGEGLFRGVGAQPLAELEGIALPRMTRAEQLVLDFERTGLSVGDHPMRFLREHLPDDVLDSRQLAGLPKGRRVTTAGVVICRQRPGTASGVVFITLEDEHGFINLVLWSKVFERLRRVALASSLLLVKGKVDASAHEADGSERVVYVIVERLERLAMPDAGGRAMSNVQSLSRDFH